MTAESTMNVKTVPRYSEFVGCSPLPVGLSLNPPLAILHRKSLEMGNYKYLQQSRVCVLCWKALAEHTETLSGYPFISVREEVGLNAELQNCMWDIPGKSMVLLLTCPCGIGLLPHGKWKLCPMWMTYFFNSNLWGSSHSPSECLFRKCVRLQTSRFVRLILLGNHNLVLTKQCRALSGQGYTACRWNDSVPLGHRVSYSNGRPQLPCSCTLQWAQRCPGMVAFYCCRFLWQWKLEHLK